MTWKDKAKRIPVWEGARFTCMDGPQRVERICLGITEQGSVVAEDGVFASDRVTLDLLHADTCAAYLRRLAIARGCPEDIARQGVIFYPSDGDYYDTTFFMKAGATHATDAHLRPRGTEWRTSFKLGHGAFHAWDTNPYVALALAWPDTTAG